MSNNKQSSIDWLESEITRRGPKENNPPQWLKELYEQAKAMHKEEIKDAISVGYNMATPSEPYDNLHKGDKHYYETFGGNNE